MGRMARHIAIGGRAWLVACAIAAALAPSAQADDVRLRRSATVESGAAITLQDVAALDGQYAQSLRDVVVVAQDAQGDMWQRIDLDAVRTALEAQGARMSVLSLSGRVCMVRVGAVEMALPEMAEEAAPVWEEYVVGDAAASADVASVVVMQLARQLELSPTDRIRVRFDDAFEDALVAADGKRVGVDAKSTASGGAALFGLTAYDEAGGIAGAWTIRVQVQVWKQAVRMTRTVNRRGTVSSGDAEVVQTWVDVGTDVANDLGNVIGAEARMRLSTGALVSTGQLEAPLAIRRGDLVQVHCLSGGLVVRGRARALKHGRVGELIECRLEDADRSFLARVDGPGRVVMEAQDQPMAGAQ